MTPRGYREEELVSNRSSLLIFGGTEEERRSWAEEAAHHFEAEGPMVVARQPQELSEALKRSKGVVFIPDVTKLGIDVQGHIVRCLQTQEERPKLVLGLSGSAEQALLKGTLREDLHYRLHKALVDLGAEGLRDSLKQRWAVLGQKLAAREAAQREAAQREREAAAARLPGSVTRIAPRSKSLPRKTAAKVTRKQP
ncbi:Fis family transcriptional regulator [Myxococcaceae bacterium GXIMD 01537]